MQNSDSKFFPLTVLSPKGGLCLYRSSHQAGFSVVADICTLPPRHERFKAIELTSAYEGHSLQGEREYLIELPSQVTVASAVSMALAKAVSSFAHLMRCFPSMRSGEVFQFVVLTWPRIDVIATPTQDGWNWKLKGTDFETQPVLSATLPDAMQKLIDLIRDGKWQVKTSVPFQN